MVLSSLEDLAAVMQLYPKQVKIDFDKGGFTKVTNGDETSEICEFEYMNLKYHIKFSFPTEFVENIFEYVSNEKRSVGVMYKSFEFSCQGKVIKSLRHGFIPKMHDFWSVSNNAISNIRTFIEHKYNRWEELKEQRTCILIDAGFIGTTVQRNVLKLIDLLHKEQIMYMYQNSSFSYKQLKNNKEWLVETIQSLAVVCSKVLDVNYQPILSENIVIGLDEVRNYLMTKYNIQSDKLSSDFYHNLQIEIYNTFPTDDWKSEFISF